jgi:hypothetical protein
MQTSVFPLMSQIGNAILLSLMIEQVLVSHVSRFADTTRTILWGLAFRADFEYCK